MPFHLWLPGDFIFNNFLPQTKQKIPYHSHKGLYTFFFANIRGYTLAQQSSPHADIVDPYTLSCYRLNSDTSRPGQYPISYLATDMSSTKLPPSSLSTVWPLHPSSTINTATDLSL
jgi:hypothetical protein